MATINGTSGNDTLTGTEPSSNYIHGLAGDDVIESHGIQDTLSGGSGNDTLTGSSQYSALSGDDGDDVITVEGDRDTVHGGDGNDSIEVTGSRNSLQGDAGADTLAATGDQNDLSGGTGDDLIVATGNTDTLSGNEGNDSIEATGGSNSLSGDAGADTLTATGNWNDLSGGIDDDLILATGDDNDLSGDVGDDLIVATGDDNYLLGGDGNDQLTSTGNDGSVTGGNGDDTLTVGDGQNVSLSGNAGSDTYVVNWTNLTPGANHSINIYDKNGNEGDVDILDLTNVVSSIGNVWFSLGNGWDLILHVTDDNGAEIGSIKLNDQMDGRGYSYLGFIEFLKVGDTLYDLTTVDDGETTYPLQFTYGQGYYWDEAPELLNSVYSAGTTQGDDTATTIYQYTTINGFAGNDTLEAAAYRSSVNGGDGNDRLIASADGVWLSGGQGNDTLVAGDALDARLNGGNDDDTLIINWENASADSPYSTRVSGWSGDDILDLSTVAPDMDHVEFARGEENTDLLVHILDDNGDRIGTVEITNQFRQWNGPLYRIETIKLGDQQLDMTFANNFETFQSVMIYGATEGPDTIIGQAADETIYALGGNDTLTAGGDNYTLYGGAGNDTFYSLSFSGLMYGAEGNDTFVIDLDQLSAGSSIFAGAGQGNDVLKLTSSSFEFSDLHFTGNGLQITDGDTAVYTIGASLKGTDQLETLIFNGVSYDLTFSDSYSELEAYYHHALTDGDDVLTVVSGSVHGLAGDDTLTAAGDRVWIYAGDGNDVLTAAAPSTVLFGGAGNDTFFNGEFSGAFIDDAGNDIYSFTYGASFTELRIEDASGNANILDISDIAKNLEHIYFSMSSWGDLILNIFKTPLSEGGGWGSDNHIARIWLNDYFEEDLYNWGTIVTGSEQIYLGAYATERSLQAYISSIVGNTVNNKVVGTSADNSLYGYGGHDTLRGGDGEDTLYGDEGDDLLIGNKGDDQAYGGDGNDQIWAGADDDGDDMFIGGAGDDSIGGNIGNDTLIGGAEDATAGSSAGQNKLYGGAGNDLVVGTGWDDSIGDTEGQFEDGEQVSSAGDKGFLWGGSGDDTIYGGMADDTVGGGTGNDNVSSGDGADVIYGGQGEGNDSVHAGDGADSVYGGLGLDTIFGEGGDDLLYGGAGNDYIDGGDGADKLFNGTGDDIVVGGAGDDTLVGGPGNDTLTGDAGQDFFVFAPGCGQDVVTDFVTNNDVLDLRETGITDINTVAEVVTIDGQTGVLITIDDSSSVFLAGMSLGALGDSSILLD